ncbi:hypothetical protein MRX96_004774 [Rhipicephalus microplus]
MQPTAGNLMRYEDTLPSYFFTAENASSVKSTALHRTAAKHPDIGPMTSCVVTARGGLIRTSPPEGDGWAGPRKHCGRSRQVTGYRRPRYPTTPPSPIADDFDEMI